MLVIASGCASPHAEVEADRTDVGHLGATIHASDLGCADADFAGPSRSGVTEPRPLLPDGLSVARVGCVELTGGRRALTLASMPERSAVLWGHTLDGLAVVRDVTILRMPGVDPRGSALRDVLHRSVELDCGLCLVYAVAPDAENYGYIGVLFDARAGTPLARYRGEADVADDVDIPVSDSASADEAALRIKVRNSLWDLAAECVQPAQPAAENPWRSWLRILPRPFIIEQGLPRSSTGRKS